MAIGRMVETDQQKYGCAAGNNCWLRREQLWCGICERGDEKKWRVRCDAGRLANGMKSYAEIGKLMGDAEQIKKEGR